KAKEVVSTQVQATNGQTNSIRAGQRVPIQTSELVATKSFPQIQYENTGFNFSFTPQVLANDAVIIKFSLEISALDNSSGALTPTFIQRVLNGAARLKTGETAMLLGLTQSDVLLPITTRADKNSGNPSHGNFCVLLRARLL